MWTPPTRATTVRLPSLPACALAAAQHASQRGGGPHLRATPTRQGRRAGWDLAPRAGPPACLATTPSFPSLPCATGEQKLCFLAADGSNECAVPLAKVRQAGRAGVCRGAGPGGAIQLGIGAAAPPASRLLTPPHLAPWAPPPAPVPQDGPIHDVQWSPKGDYFVVGALRGGSFAAAVQTASAARPAAAAPPRTSTRTVPHCLTSPLSPSLPPPLQWRASCRPSPPCSQTSAPPSLTWVSPHGGPAATDGARHCRC